MEIEFEISKGETKIFQGVVEKYFTKNFWVLSRRLK
jgi:hypothetical protein